MSIWTTSKECFLNQTTCQKRSQVVSQLATMSASEEGARLMIFININNIININIITIKNTININNIDNIDIINIINIIFINIIIIINITLRR